MLEDEKCSKEDELEDELSPEPAKLVSGEEVTLLEYSWFGEDDKTIMTNGRDPFNGKILWLSVDGTYDINTVINGVVQSSIDTITAWMLANSKTINDQIEVETIAAILKDIVAPGEDVIKVDEWNRTLEINSKPFFGRYFHKTEDMTITVRYINGVVNAVSTSKLQNTPPIKKDF